MARFDPLFGRVSFEKAAKFIAIFDLVVCCLYILSHFIGGGYIYGIKSEEYETELSKDVKIDETPIYGPFPSDSDYQTTTKKPINNVISYDDFKKLMDTRLPSVDVLIVLGLCLVIFSIAHICMEVWMCRLLLKAATHKDGSALKIWFWCRLGVTLMFMLYSIVGILTVDKDIVDWVFESLNLYRFYTLYIVYEFKSHVSACSSLSKPIEI